MAVFTPCISRIISIVEIWVSGVPSITFSVDIGIFVGYIPILFIIVSAKVVILHTNVVNIASDRPTVNWNACFIHR